LVNKELSIQGQALDQVTSVSIKQDGVAIPFSIVGQSAYSLFAKLGAGAALSFAKPIQLLVSTAHAQTSIQLTIDLSGATVANFKSTGIIDLASMTAITIDGSGDVGIGTATPIGKMHIQDNVNDDSYSMVVENPNSGNNASANILIYNSNGNGYLNAGVASASYYDSFWRNRTYVQSGPALGGLVIDAAGGSQPIILATNSAERARIDSSGHLGVGTSSPLHKVDVAGDVNASGALRVAGVQICTSAGCAGASDARLKKDVRDLEGALENVLRLKGVGYAWIDKRKYGASGQIGLIAQDVEKIYPQAVVTDPKTGFKSVAYGHLIAPVIESVKALFDKLTAIDERVLALEGEVASMKFYICANDPKAPFCGK
jgi:hypothetical protein